ncbi:MAG: winged helix DNA-binding protein [Paludibacter sp.]|nr:winged helix DNA-binding protein [Paludibacter sp.]
MAAVGQNLCKIRDIFRSIMDFEADFRQKHNLCLNEGMLLCSLQNGKLSTKELAKLLGLTLSNSSKVIKSLENKMFIKRTLGKTDKRQMYFSLTAKGSEKLKEINCKEHSILLILNDIADILQTNNYEQNFYNK